MENNIKLTWVDAWLLSAILYCKKKNGTFELKSVINVGEVINHSIFDYEEINVGIERLVLTGFLSTDEDKILVTDKAIKLYELIEIREGTASPIIRFQQIEKELDVIPYGKVPYGINYKANSIYPKEYFSEQEYQNAIKGEVKLTNFLGKILKLLQFIKGDTNK